LFEMSDSESESRPVLHLMIEKKRVSKHGTVAKELLLSPLSQAEEAALVVVALIMEIKRR
jgi:hypothetical protein